MRIQNAAIRGVLWAIILLGCPALTLTAAMRPAWDPTAAAGAIPLVSGSALALLVTGHRRYPRAAHARPWVTLQQLLWAGIPAAMFIIAIAASDLPRLRALDYCGTVLLLNCTGGLALRRWFARRAQRPVDRKVYELAQNVAWTRQDVTRLQRLLVDMLGYVKGDPSEGAGDHARRRHLRPVRNDDTGPQRAVLGRVPLLTAALL